MRKEQVKVYRLALKVLDGKMSIVDFSILTGKSYRQARQIIQRIRSMDLDGMFHGNSKKTPVNMTSLSSELENIKLLKTKYHGFNLIHFKEMIEVNEGIRLSNATLYRIAKKHSLQVTKYRRSNRLHKPRARHAQEGMLVQFDGSEHPWFNDQFCDLIAAIDDATGKILAAEFFKGETSNNSMKVIREVIIAGSPQAKGRVERLFKTLQSRLVSELKIFNITTSEAANRLLKNDFIPRFNERFGVEARNQEKATFHTYLKT